MDNNQNKYIAVSYMLYDVTDGKQELIEQTSEDRPFDFLSALIFFPNMSDHLFSTVSI